MMFLLYLDIHQSNIDLLGIDSSPSDSYLQAMNDNLNLHKKFRRQNHLDYQHSISTDFLRNNRHQLYHSNQLNGDYQNNMSKSTVSNGQLLSMTVGGNNNKNNHDDDDNDIVLVSDDDSEDKKTEIKINRMLLFLFLNSSIFLKKDMFI